MAKPLFEFEVSIEQEVDEVTTKNENGQEITVKSKVKKKVPYKIIMKRPARRENDDLRLFYGAQLAKAIKANLLTKAVLVNNHIDGAGALLSKETAKRVAFLYEKSELLRQDLIRLGVTEDSQKKKEDQEKNLLELLEYKREIEAIESSNQVVFSNTAEAFAQEKANMWLILFQTYIEKDGKIEQMFKGDDFAKKEDYCFDLEEKEDPLFSAAREKLALYWGMYALNRANSPEDFRTIEEELEKQSQVADKSKEESAPAEKEPEIKEEAKA